MFGDESPEGFYILDGECFRKLFGRLPRSRLRFVVVRFAEPAREEGAGTAGDLARPLGVVEAAEEGVGKVS